MATSHYFNGRTVKLPGAYSAVKSVSPTVFTSASYSKALIINTNPAQGFGGSVDGELTRDADALYRLRSLSEAQAFLKSGQLWQLTQPLFIPSRLEGTTGASEVYYINALTTIAPTLSPTLDGGTNRLVLKCKDEGVASNGVATAGHLDSGYALSIESGLRDTTKFIIKIWLGTFKGVYTKDNTPYDGLFASDCPPELVSASPEVSTLREYLDWAVTDENFNNGFVIDPQTSSDHTFVAADMTANALVLATGGTSTYNLANLQAALEILRKIDFNAILSLSPVDETGSDVINSRLQYFAQSESKNPKYIVVPGKSTGNASTDLSANIAAAKVFNSERVWVVNGTPRKNVSYVPGKFREYDSTYLAALVTGRILGLPPQVPATFKDLDIDGLTGGLSDLQKEDALDAGVLCVHYDDDLEYYSIVRAINTLQKNTQIQNPDGSTFSIQVSRICTQLNTDLATNAKVELFGNNVGANLFTVSPEYMKGWTEVYLQNLVATDIRDNLIVGWSNVSVERRADAYYITYKFETNTEISFAFFTGFAVN
jgi:hypothetical protein